MLLKLYRRLLELVLSYPSNWTNTEAFECGITSSILQFVSEQKTKEKQKVVMLVVRFLLLKAADMSTPIFQMLLEYCQRNVVI